jgi:hypothetical protein
MPRKQRFKPSRKPKPVEIPQESVAQTEQPVSNTEPMRSFSSDTTDEVPTQRAVIED